LTHGSNKDVFTFMRELPSDCTALYEHIFQSKMPRQVGAITRWQSMLWEDGFKQQNHGILRNGYGSQDAYAAGTKHEA
jgi:hypothetical protein